MRKEFQHFTAAGLENFELFGHARASSHEDVWTSGQGAPVDLMENIVVSVPFLHSTFPAVQSIFLLQLTQYYYLLSSAHARLLWHLSHISRGNILTPAAGCCKV